MIDVMSKFQTGDKVRFKNDDEAFIGLGRIRYDCYKALNDTSLTVSRVVGGLVYLQGVVDSMGGVGVYPRRLVKTKKISKQGIFSFVYKFLVKQGRQARDEAKGVCVYRLKTPDATLACAVGCLVTDAEAATLLSGSWFFNVRVGRAPQRFAGFEEFIADLQDIHDRRFTTLAQFKNEMASLAALHGLKVPNV
jgi:hypothetical protein